MALLEPFLPRPKTRGSSVLHHSCISVRHGLTCQELISCFQRRHESHPRCTLQSWDVFPREQPCSLTRKNTFLSGYHRMFDCSYFASAAQDNSGLPDLQRSRGLLWKPTAIQEWEDVLYYHLQLPPFEELFDEHVKYLHRWFYELWRYNSA